MSECRPHLIRQLRPASSSRFCCPARAEIKTIASAARLPLNVLARPGLPTASELEALGVRRLSAGSTIAEAVFADAAARATAFLRAGTAEPLAEGALRYADINALMLNRKVSVI